MREMSQKLKLAIQKDIAKSKNFPWNFETIHEVYCAGILDAEIKGDKVVFTFTALGRKIADKIQSDNN